MDQTNVNGNLNENLQNMKLDLDKMPKDNKDDDDETDDEAIVDDSDYYSQEYSHVDAALDEINSYMDELEKRNDKLLNELKNLLNDNIQTRKELEECRSSQRNTEEEDKSADT